MDSDEVPGASSCESSPDLHDQNLGSTAVAPREPQGTNNNQPFGGRDGRQVRGAQDALFDGVNQEFHVPPSNDTHNGTRMTLREFVEQRFVPEYVATKRPAGQAHFEAMLKHVLKPEQVVRAFRGNCNSSTLRLRELPGWPYMDSHKLHEIDSETVQRLISASLRHGYSTQTATHIRNVVRAIFSHALNTSCYTGRNPASRVELPAMSRRESHVLTFGRLKQLVPMMNYPERTIALFAMLTDMSVAEICGLQWRYVNLADHRGRAEGEWLPPMNIAVRKQRYRGHLSRVIENRKRFIPIQRLLQEVLTDLKRRAEHTGPQDFVIITRNGSPVYPENSAARRLKTIGKELDMPWLSWSVFCRTRAALKSELGGHWAKMLEEILSPGLLTSD